jgi:hypothetical protein
VEVELRTLAVDDDVGHVLDEDADVLHSRAGVGAGRVRDVQFALLGLLGIDVVRAVREPDRDGVPSSFACSTASAIAPAESLSPVGSAPKSVTSMIVRPAACTAMTVVSAAAGLEEP